MIITNFLQQIEISSKNLDTLNANYGVQAFIESQQFDDLFNFVNALLNDSELAKCSQKPTPKYIGHYTCRPKHCSGNPLINFAPLNGRKNCENDFWIARISLDPQGIKYAPIYFPKIIVDSSYYNHSGIDFQRIKDQNKRHDFVVMKDLSLLKENPVKFISIPAVKTYLA